MSDKIKFEIEYVIQSSPQLLYQYLVTPSGLSEWFADNVNSRGEKYIFIWDGSEEEAKLLRRAEEGRLRTINVDDFEPEELAAKPYQPEEKDIAA